jgi:hypothetical protein
MSAFENLSLVKNYWLAHAVGLDVLGERCKLLSVHFWEQAGEGVKFERAPIVFHEFSVAAERARSPSPMAQMAHTASVRLNNQIVCDIQGQQSNYGV